MQIVTCQKDDLSILAEVAKKSYIQHYTYLWEDAGESYVTKSFNSENLESEFVEEGTKFFLIKDGDSVLGFVKLNVNKMPEGGFHEDYLELERIYLLKEAIGKGFGKFAMDFVSKFALDSGKKILWLKVMDSSPALGFYEKSGFVKINKSVLNIPKIKEDYKNMFLMKRGI